MFQSNKNKTSLSLIVFILICIIITAIAIYLTNEEIINLPIKETNQIEQKQSIKPDGLGIKTLEDKYSINNLNIKNEEFYPYPKIKQDQYYEYYPIEIRYVQISGLKNTAIQEKINKEIKEKTISQMNIKEMREQNLKQIIISAYCTANYSNVLSIQIDKYVVDEASNYITQKEFIGLNYNLKTGEKINFSDLFTNDAGTKNIIAQSAYTTFAREYLDYFWEDDEWDGDMQKIDYSSIEDRTLKVLQSYDKNKNYQFGFSERYIYAYINNEIISIEMRKFYNQIAIYNRYAKYEGIFEKNPTEELYVFMLEDRQEDEIYNKVEKIGDNLFIDIKLFNWTDKENNINAEKYIQEIEEKIKECKNYLNTNTNEAIVLAIYSELLNGENYDENGEIREITYSCKATMSKTYFNDTYLNRVLEWEQTDRRGGDILSVNLTELLREDNEEDKNIKVEIEYPLGY